MTEFQSLDPRVLRVWRLGAAIPLLVVLAGVVVAGMVVNGWLVWVIGLAVFAVVAISAIVFPGMEYRRWSYALRPHDLVLRHGVVIHVERMVPRTRIQHVDLVEGALDRWLGLARLRIFTAGSSTADVAVPGLARPVAERLRDELLSWVEDRSPVVQPDRDTRAGGPGPAAFDPDTADLPSVRTTNDGVGHGADLGGGAEMGSEDGPGSMADGPSS